MFDIKRIVNSVTSSEGGAYASRLFGIDVLNYSWVKDFVRDQDIRNKIVDLQEKILNTSKLLIHRDELKKQFISQVEQTNEFRIKQIIELLSRVQKRDVLPYYTKNAIGQIKVLDALYLPYFIKFSSSDIDTIFSQLPEGVRQEDIDQTIEECKIKITDYEKVIDQELSPQSRWLHRDNGNPMPYPQGCRWKAFVDVWRMVQQRFDGPVNINGSGLKTDAEFMAHAVLKLDKVNKLLPLREPL